MTDEHGSALLQRFQYERSTELIGGTTRAAFHGFYGSGRFLTVVLWRWARRIWVNNSNAVAETWFHDYCLREAVIFPENERNLQGAALPLFRLASFDDAEALAFFEFISRSDSYRCVARCIVGEGKVVTESGK